MKKRNKYALERNRRVSRKKRGERMLGWMDRIATLEACSLYFRSKFEMGRDVDKLADAILARDAEVIGSFAHSQVWLDFKALMSN